MISSGLKSDIISVYINPGATALTKAPRPAHSSVKALVTPINPALLTDHSVLMGVIRRDWQAVDYVLSCFGKQPHDSRSKYHAFVSEGAGQKRLDGLTGGGFLRSLDRWSPLGKNELKNTRVKSDERILGDSDFVDSMLTKAGQKFERFYEVKRSGYDLDITAKRASDLCGVELEDIYFRSKQAERVKARSLFCYWASREPGFSHTELAKD